MKVSLNFTNIKDSDLSIKFRTIGVNMRKNIQRWVPKPPLDLDEFLGVLDQYDHLIVVAADGSRTAISQRNKLRHQASKMATQLGHYVEGVSEDDLEIVYAAGFEPANKYRLLPVALPKTDIAKVIRGPNSGTAMAYIVPISRSKYGKVVYYELRYASKNGDDIGEFTVIPTLVARFPIPIKNLTPGTVYIFQVRATNKKGFNDWSDPLNYIAT
jgi:hypothetical protein